MIIKIIKKENSEYDKLYSVLYENNVQNELICNCVPVTWNNLNWVLVTNSDFLRYLESNLDFDAIIYLNKTKYKNLTINKNRIIPLYNKNLLEIKSNDQLKYDCYYDVFLNLILIKCKFDLEYSYSVDSEKKIDYDNFRILWTGDDLNLNQLEINNLSNKIKYKWETKYISEPPILNLEINFEQFYNIYSGAVLVNEQNIIGIVENILDNDISLISYLTIKKFFTKLTDCTNNYLDINTNPILIDKKNNIYGICIENNIFNKYITKDENGVSTKIVIEILEKGTIIKSIDNYQINSKGNINLINKNTGENGLEYCDEIPIKSYIYFIKNEYIRDNEYILKLEILRDNQGYEFEINNRTINILESQLVYENIDITVVNRLNTLRNVLTNMIVIRKENIYLLELNEYLLNLLKKYLINNNYDLVEKIHELKYSNNIILIGIRIVKPDCEHGFNNINLNNQKNIKIEILQKYSSINQLLEKFKNKIKLVHYLKKIL